MKSTKIKELLREELSKSDVKDIIKQELNGSSLKSKVEDIIKKRIQNDPQLEDKVVEITKNVLTQLYKQLWVKRNFWRSGLKNSAT